MKVTLRHYEYYALAGMFFAISALAGGLMLTNPGAVTEPVIAILVVSMGMVCSAAFFVYARCFEVLDETGIRVKSPFSDKHYPWSDVEKLAIDVVYNGKGGKYPKLSLKVKNNKRPLKLAYTKRSLECVSFYYGAPDEDKWKKPPTLL